jgi:peptide deformylase
MFKRKMKYKLVYYGNETLKCVADEVKNIDGEIKELIDSMYNVMYKEKGIGLAAPQVDVSKRLIVIDVESYNGPAITVINPVIKEFSPEKVPYEEGCLSLPGISEEIIRPEKILLAGVTLDEKEIELEAEGLFARVLQHEIDHLNGKVFVDHLEDYIRKELKPQLKKIKKMNRDV